jgi:hypothetical protein
MSVPRVYTAINVVSADLARTGLAKTHLNQADQYYYRAIDDLYDCLSPLLAQHKLCILPRVLERTCTEREGLSGELLMSVTVKAAFDMVSSEDGSSHVIESYGEALDGGDKGTAKAMSAAYKHAILQAFCVPVNGLQDADGGSAKLRSARGNPKAKVQPEQGWDQWADDVQDVVRVCETVSALDLVQERHRALLGAIKRERPDLYGSLGTAISTKREELSPRSATHPTKRPTRKKASTTKVTKA